MNTKRILIGLPIVVILFLLQSVLWVPSQKRQAVMTPSRLTEYYDASIADAAILNPILNADSASSDICAKIFDGLLDYDENLNRRGRLAKSWIISEEAYLWTKPQLAQTLKSQILFAAQSAPEGSPLRSIKNIAILPPEKEKRPLPIGIQGSASDQINVQLPWRLKITLSKVEQDLFKVLEKGILGENYSKSFNLPSHLLAIPIDEANNIAPHIISPFEHNPVIEFNLRKNVRFHDGHPFTAQDVNFTFEAIMDGKNLSPRRSDYEPVKKMEILGPHQIKIIYKRLYSPALGTWGIGILPKHLLEKNKLREEAISKGKDPQSFTLRQSQFNRHPIGTGAFKFSEWKNDQYIKLLRNEDYWEGAPNYREYVVRVLPESLAQEMEFYAGTIDGYAPLPFQVERLKKLPQYQSFSGVSYGYTYIGYNLRNKLFQDRRVRKALGMALDVDSMIQYVYYGHAERITGPFVKVTDYYNHELPPLPYNPEKAQQLLKEAGWVKNNKGKLVNQKGEPFRFTLITNNGNDTRRDIMIIAEQAWSKLGIEISIQPIEWAVFIKKHVSQGNFDAVVLGWSLGLEPDLFQIWHSSQTHPEQLNFIGYKNPKADELIIRIRQEYDKKKLIEYCHQLHRIIYDDQPYTFLAINHWTALLDKRIVRQFDTPEGEKFEKIKATKTGNYTYFFNQWVKLKSLQNVRVLTSQ